MCTKMPTMPDTFHHGAISRFNAWFFDAWSRYINFVAREHKRSAYAGIEPGRILEIGAGTGANFAWLPEDSEILALEPSLAMHEALMKNAKASGRPVTLLPASAERLPLDDDSVDTVVASLVLCTVGDPDAVLAEIRRVLKPGGTFRFVEHVAAHPASPRRWVQAAIARPWAWLFEGCDTRRDTPRYLERAGFTSLEVRRSRFRQSFFFPVNSAIWGIATK